MAATDQRSPIENTNVGHLQRELELIVTTLLSDSAHRWTANEVVDVGGPEFVIRTYAEQSGVRRYISQVSRHHMVVQACEVGAGYGRLCPVLKEFSQHVVAFEREPELRTKGSFLQPTVEFREMASPERLPAVDGEFDFALTFTMLQHLTDEMAQTAMAEIRRIVRADGFVLICEESDDAFTEGDPTNPKTYFTFGRSVERYKRWMEPFRLVDKSPRQIERGYDRANVGDFLLFRAPRAQ